MIKFLEMFLVKIYTELIRIDCLTLNVVDYGDLLLQNLNIFKSNPEILITYQKKFKYILVDEYQDTNICQNRWLNLLAENFKNICAVGDDDQSIYSWRGEK